MAKTKPNTKKSKKREKSILNKVAAVPLKPNLSSASPSDLLEQALTALHLGDIAASVPLAKRALALSDEDSNDSLPALNLLGEIHVELGDILTARQYFLRAVALDQDGAIAEDLGGGPEKFFWLAQLSEDGGQDSVKWYEQGARSLRSQIQAMRDAKKTGVDADTQIEEKERKLAAALCGVVEVYMTDLSWEDDAEQKCETLVTEATMIAPGFAEPWQTLANVRISQSRIEDAKAALQRSLELWKDLPPESNLVPDFPTRVSLARLLMEAEMEVEAIEVLERLISEDDSSVEVWYLGGWCMFVIGDKQKEEKETANADGESWRVSWISSQLWLTQSLRLYDMQDYEDERLGEHAKELLSILNNELGGPISSENGEDYWEDDESDSEKDDEEMT